MNSLVLVCVIQSRMSGRLTCPYSRCLLIIVALIAGAEDSSEDELYERQASIRLNSSYATTFLTNVPTSQPPETSLEPHEESSC